MHLKTLKLQNFRNYEDESFALDPAVNLICGENGQGKTNLLEAAAACSTMRLFRTAQKKEGLRFGADDARICAEFEAQGRDHTLELRLSRLKAMEIYKNGVRQKRQSDVQGLLKTVLFCPEDLMLVRAGAAALSRHRAVSAAAELRALSGGIQPPARAQDAHSARQRGKAVAAVHVGGLFAAHGAYRRTDHPLSRLLLPQAA